MYLLKAAKVILGFPGDVINNGAVLVDGDKIIAAGEYNQISFLKDDRTKEIDLEDATLMPGLIDAHVHLGFDGSTNPVKEMMESTDHQLLAQMIYNAKLLLRSGVTTARELGARNYLDIVVKEAIEKGIAEGPSLLVSNRPITTTGGHCWYMGCECDNATEVRKAVREHAKAGADLIKIMATGGALTKGSSPWEARFTLEEMQAATNEAHTLGLKVASHAHGTPGIETSIEAGVDTIEHCSWFTENGIQYDEEQARKLIEKNIYVCPTTNISWKIDQRRITERIPQLKRMHEMGVKFIFGTDAGIPHVTHDKYVDGLEILTYTGMTNGEILESATSLAAEALGVSEITGSIQAGKRADLIAIEGDPLTDLAVLRNIRFVMSKGKIPSFVYGLAATKQALGNQI